MGSPNSAHQLYFFSFMGCSPLAYSMRVRYMGQGAKVMLAIDYCYGYWIWLSTNLSLLLIIVMVIGYGYWLLVDYQLLLMAIDYYYGYRFMVLAIDYCQWLLIICFGYLLFESLIFRVQGLGHQGFIFRVQSMGFQRLDTRVSVFRVLGLTFKI